MRANALAARADALAGARGQLLKDYLCLEKSMMFLHETIRTDSSELDRTSGLFTLINKMDP